MTDAGRHPNITLLTMSEVRGITGFVGSFHVRILKRARYVREKECTACGDFFAMGGHSLLAAKLVAKIGQAFRVDFPFSAFFDKPTIPDTERTLEQLIGSRTKLEKIARLRLELSKLSPEQIQARLAAVSPAGR